VGSIAEVLHRYPSMEALVPAMGYDERQVADLEATLNASGADLVLSATPIDLAALTKLTLPVTRVGYELVQASGPALADLLAPVLATARTAVAARGRR
jgi:predicted GTPase